VAADVLSRRRAACWSGVRRTFRREPKSIFAGGCVACMPRLQRGYTAAASGRRREGLLGTPLACCREF